MLKNNKILIIGIISFLAVLCYGATSSPWDGTTWDVTAPDIDQPIGNHYKEIYDLRKGVAIRANKEHETYAGSSVGGVHKQGSARAFWQDAAPTTQIDGTAWDAGDTGSIWFDTNSTPDNLVYALTNHASTGTWTLLSESLFTFNDIAPDSVVTKTPIINVKHPDFGAVGGGVTDDYAAIQAAINTMVEYSILEFPPGVYAISAPLVFPDTFSFTVRGHGTAVIKATANMTSLIEGGGLAWRSTGPGTEELKFGAYPDNGTGTFPGLYRWQGIQFKGLLLDCEGKANYGIHINTSAHDVRMDKCKIFYPKVSGILVDDFMFDVFIDDCRVTGGDGKTDAVLPVYYVGGVDDSCIGIELACSDAHVTNTVIQACDIGIKCDRESGGVNQVANITLRGNHIYHIKSTGILCESRGVSILQNTFDLCEIYNIRISNEDNSSPPVIGTVDVIGNNFIGTGTYYFNPAATPVYFYIESGTAASKITNLKIIGNNFQGALGTDIGGANTVWDADNFIHSNSGNWSDENAVANVWVVRDPTNDADLVIDRPAGKFGTINFRTAWVNRWTMGVNDTAEGGSDAGSDFSINARDDAGDFKYAALTIDRATGSVIHGRGSQDAAIEVTAGGAAIPKGASAVKTVSGAAASVIPLPAPVLGNIIWLMPNSTGYELRSSDPATIAINGGTGVNAESAIAADVTVRCVCTSTTTWVCNQFTANGTESAVTPAAP